MSSSNSSARMFARLAPLHKTASTEQQLDEEAREYLKPSYGNRKSMLLDELTRDESPPPAVIAKPNREEPYTMTERRRGKQKAVEYHEEAKHEENDDDEEDEDDLPFTLTELQTRSANPLTTFSSFVTPTTPTFSDVPLDDSPFSSAFQATSYPPVEIPSPLRQSRKNSFEEILSIALANEADAEAEEEVKGLSRRSTTPPPPLPSLSIADLPRVLKRDDQWREGARGKEEGFEMVDLEAGDEAEQRRKRERAKTVVVEQQMCEIM